MSGVGVDGKEEKVEFGNYQGVRSTKRHARREVQEEQRQSPGLSVPAEDGEDVLLHGAADSGEIVQGVFGLLELLLQRSVTVLCLLECCLGGSEVNLAAFESPVAVSNVYRGS